MNYNNLSQRTNFIAGSNAFKNIPFFLTTLNIPGINMNLPETGGRAGTILKLPSDTVNFNSLSFEMLIDEDFLIYQEIMDIFKNNINVEHGTFGNFQFDFYIEINNNKGHKVIKLDFHNCRLASIGDIQLSTADEEVEHSMSMELEYDYYTVESIKMYNILPSTLTKIPTNFIPKNKFDESFSSLSADWVTWGATLPIIVNDTESTNKNALDTNGGVTENGLVLNAIPVPVLSPFEFIFRVKQPAGADLNADYYIDFGITEGIGISSLTNGRTGSTVMGVIVDGGNKDSGASTKETIYTIKNDTDLISADFDNDGKYHEYKISYTTNGVNATYEIYKDGSLEKTFTGVMSTHDYFYLYIQGKSVDGEQYVDLISGTYG